MEPKENERSFFVLLLSSIEPMDLINSFTGSMVLLLLLLLPINESGCQSTFYTAEYHFMQNPPTLP
jgi:hypothetical protein